MTIFLQSWRSLTLWSKKKRIKTVQYQYEIQPINVQMCTDYSLWFTCQNNTPNKCSEPKRTLNIYIMFTISHLHTSLTFSFPSIYPIFYCLPHPSRSPSTYKHISLTWALERFAFMFVGCLASTTNCKYIWLEYEQQNNKQKVHLFIYYYSIFLFDDQRTK